MGELEAAAAATGIELYAGGSKTRQQKALASIKNHQPDIFADEAQVMEKLESEFERNGGIWCLLVIESL